MKKLNKVASLFATAALASSFSASAQSRYADQRQLGERHRVPWKNGPTSCAGAMASGRPPPACKAATAFRRRPRRRPPRRPRARARPAPAPAPAAPPAAVVPAPTSEKVTFAADAFFDFDKSVLKPEGRAKLDDLVSKMSGLNLEVIIAVGHTDSVGADAYNQKLSVRRSEAVKAYLVSKGVEKNRVYTEGKGEKQPVADNKTAEGRAKNRRVEIEVVGTRGR